MIAHVGRRLMARRPAPGDPVRVDGVTYRVATAASPIAGAVYVERPCGCEWLLIDLVQLHWDRWRAHWRADRAAVFAAGGAK